MRSRIGGSLMVGLLVLFSCSILVISTGLLVGSVRANTQPGNKKTCTKNTSTGCTTCDNSNDTYQCSPSTLGTDCIYGTCPAVGNGPCGTGCIGNCGKKDWTCATPSVVIPNSSQCIGEVCLQCCTASTCQ